MKKTEKRIYDWYFVDNDLHIITEDKEHTIYKNAYISNFHIPGMKPAEDVTVLKFRKETIDRSNYKIIEQKVKGWSKSNKLYCPECKKQVFYPGYTCDECEITLRIRIMLPDEK